MVLATNLRAPHPRPSAAPSRQVAPCGSFFHRAPGYGFSVAGYSSTRYQGTLEYLLCRMRSCEFIDTVLVLEYPELQEVDSIDIDTYFIDIEY